MKNAVITEIDYKPFKYINMKAIKELTPELQQRIEAIYHDSKESMTDYYKERLSDAERYDSDAMRDYNISQYETLSLLSEFTYSLYEHSGLITSSLADELKRAHLTGCMTDQKIDNIFYLIGTLIQIAGSRENIDTLSRHYCNRVDTFNSIEGCILDDFINGIDQ